MGFTRYLCYAAPVLASCSQQPESTYQFGRELRYEQTVDRLEVEVAALKRDQAAQAKLISSIIEDQGTTAEAINNIARISNENAAADMTRRGACGQEYIRLESGAYTLRNRTCTVGDLHRDEK